MTRMMITEATRLLHNGLNLRFNGRRGAELDWVCDRTKEAFTFTDGQLASLLATRDAEFQTIGSPPIKIALPNPENIEPEELASAQRKLDYVMDMHDSGLIYRARLADFEQQILATAKRIEDELPPEPWTVKRWLKRAGDTPTVWRMIDRTRYKGNRTDRLNIEEQTITYTVIEKHYLARPPISLDSLLPFVRVAIRHANVDRDADALLRVPERRAVETLISRLDPEMVYAKRFGQAAALNKFGKTNTLADPKAPLDRIEIDHTVADLYVVSDDDFLPIGRPTVGIAIDRCTRMPFGIYIGFEPPSVLTVMQVLKNGMFPKDYVREKIEAGEWDFQHDWPVWGVPRTLVFDRAMENLGEDIRSAALELGIRDVTFTASKTPRQKGGVERYFRTQNQRLLHQQRGTTFSNVIQRGDYDAKQNAIISLSDFQKMTHRYLVDIYPYSQHGGLKKALPADVWSRLIDKYPSDPVKPIDDLVHLFTRVETGTLTREGLVLKGLHYNSDDLSAIRMSAAFRQVCPNRRVTFRWDPADLKCIWVKFDHLNRYLIVEPTPQWADYAVGTSMWEHLQIQAYHRETNGSAYDPDRLAEARVALMADMEASAAGRKRSSTAKRKARLEGVGRISPAGASHATTPVGSAHDRKAKAASKPSPANDTATDRMVPSKNRTPAIGTLNSSRTKTISFDIDDDEDDS